MATAQRLNEWFGKRKWLRRSLVIAVGLVVLLVLAFQIYDNRWATIVSNGDFFWSWQLDSEQLVLDKMWDARENGVWNYAGLMTEYRSQSGLQAFVFSMLDGLLGARADIVKLLHFGNSALLAAVFIALAYWFWKEFNVLAGAAVLWTAFYAHWMTVSGRNLYWVVWTFFVPFLFTLFLLWKRQNEGKRTLVLLAIGNFLACLVRFACGFEFMTVVLIGLELPIVYYAIKRKWSLKQYVRHALVAALGGLAAFVVAALVLLLQLSYVEGGFGQALYLLQYTVAKRTILVDMEVAEVFARSFDVSIKSVLKEYFTTRMPVVNQMNMTHITYIASLFAVLCWVDKRRLPALGRHARGLNAMLATIAVAYAGPLSWYILALGHSSIHYSINFILWYMPLVFLIGGGVGAWLGYFVHDLARLCGAWLRQKGLLRKDEEGPAKTKPATE